MELEDSKNALFADPNAYIQKVKDQKQTKKIVRTKFHTFLCIVSVLRINQRNYEESIIYSHVADRLVPVGFGTEGSVVFI